MTSHGAFGETPEALGRRVTWAGQRPQPLGFSRRLYDRDPRASVNATWTAIRFPSPRPNAPDTPT
jgi:hypothetical protein